MGLSTTALPTLRANDAEQLESAPLECLRRSHAALEKEVISRGHKILVELTPILTILINIFKFHQNDEIKRI